MPVVTYGFVPTFLSMTVIASHRNGELIRLEIDLIWFIARSAGRYISGGRFR